MSVADEKDAGVMPEDFMNKVSLFDFNDPSIQHDRVLIIEEKKFYVQAGLLSICSEYFRGLFNSDFKEKTETEIKLQDISSADDFEVFLKVIYPGFFEIQASHIESLVGFAYRFLAPLVLEFCEKFIEKEYANLDKLMLFKLASTHNMVELKTRIYNEHNNMEEWDFIELLKTAFQFQDEKLKRNIRVMIYTADRESMWAKCNECPGKLHRKNCTHQEISPTQLNRNSLITKNIDKILELPVEIKDFVMVSTISWN